MNRYRTRPLAVTLYVCSAVLVLIGMWDVPGSPANPAPAIATAALFVIFGAWTDSQGM